MIRKGKEYINILHILIWQLEKMEFYFPQIVAIKIYLIIHYL